MESHTVPAATALAASGHAPAPVQWIDRWPVVLRMFAATCIALLMIGALGTLEMVLMMQEDAAHARLATADRAQRALADLGAKRDAIRGDVFALFIRRDDVEAQAPLSHALDEYRRTALGALSLQGSPEVQQALAGEEHVVVSYLNAATTTAQLVQHDRAAALAALPTFQRSFAALTEAHTRMRQRIANRTAEATQKAETARRVRMWILGLASLTAFVIVAVVGRVVALSVSRALSRVRAAAHAIAEGDLTVRSEALVDDDIGAVAGAVNRMADALQTMITRLKAEQEQDAFSRQLSEVLDMADTEADTYEVAARGMSLVSHGLKMELLVADSSRAHLERATVHPDTGAPGCTVDSPYGCMAVRRGNPIVFESSAALNACSRLRDRSTEAACAVCVPLSFMGRSVGVLHAAGKAGELPPQRVISQLTTLGILTGSRLGTVRAFEHTQVQASTDGLTGLLNRRALESRVRLLARRTAYAVIVADVDNFKRLNDTQGHEAGDRALRLLADVLRRSLREQDHAARWGGEEFVIVLEAVDAAGASSLVERIANSLAVATRGTQVPDITVSFGIADSAMADSFDQLVKIADDALYQSKENGRNRATIGDPTRVGASVPRRDTEHMAVIEVEALTATH